MTCMCSQFHHTPSSHCSVHIGDGSLTQAANEGLISISPTLPLPTVRHVPKFPSNLVFVSRMTKPHNCSIIFLFPTHCVFQDLKTGHRQIIGTSWKSSDLYLCNSQMNGSTVFQSLAQRENLVQWHFHWCHVRHMFITSVCSFQRIHATQPHTVNW